jgi:hypothetical protein
MGDDVLVLVVRGKSKGTFRLDVETGGATGGTVGEL